jgi:S-formylglutathione hydrolase FrmB
MALLRCDFFSETLGLSTSMTVILPQETRRQIGMTGSTSDLPPVLYLLHGLSDDDTIWTRRTSIERYVARLGLAVVMPQVHHSFYANEAQGLPFWSFLTEELPTLVHRFFRVSEERADTFVAGLSMGGYGAMKWALREPWRFAAAASLSGALGLRHPSPLHDPDFARLMQRVFGDGPTEGTDDDVLHLLRSSAGADLPALYVGCGTEDFLHPANQWFIDEAQAAGVPLTVRLGPGDHDWAYWDAQIQDVLAWLPLPPAELSAR